jgi:hypothetical protein
MGNYITYTTPSIKVTSSCKLGTNGSGLAFLKLFAVAYAASSFPDAKRARTSVRVVPNRQHNKSSLIKTKNDVIELLAPIPENVPNAEHLNQCFWADFDAKKAGAGHFLKPTTCEIYEGVLVPIINMDLDKGGTMVLSELQTKKTADAWAAMIPILEAANCVAIQTLRNMAVMAREAADQTRMLIIS